MPVLNYAKALRLGTAVAKAAHLDHHRVWPLPPPFLEPPMGQVTTPDLPIDTIDSDIRLRFKIRANSLSMPSGNASMLAMQRPTGATNLMWDMRARDTGAIDWRWSVTGTAFLVGPVTHPTGTLVVGQDLYLGARFEQFTTFRGEASADGTTWADNGQVNTYAPLVPFDSTAPVTIGGVPSGYTRFPGRIYWMQWDAIHLARLQFPGVVGAAFTGPNLWTTGGSAQGVEILVRVGTKWVSGASSDFQGIVYAGARWGVRRSTSAGGPINFYAYAPDGTAYSPSGTIPASWVDDQMVWIRAAHDGTANMHLQWAPDSLAVPTTWTDLRAPQAVTVPGLRAAAQFIIGSDSAALSSRMFPGRIARVIVRDTIGGPAVFDMSENDAGNMGAGTSFTTRSGATITPPNQSAPAAYLDSTVGTYATTPDAPELRIIGDVRLTARVRDDAVIPETAQSRIIIDKSTGGYAYRLSTYGAGFMAIGWPLGTASPQIGPTLATRTEMGMTPGNDVYVGAELVGVDPNSSAATLVPTAVTSADGTTWTRKTPAAAQRADGYSFPSTGALRISYSWQGRIYWAQVERINRRTFMFNRTVTNQLAVPLDLTGVDQLEIVARYGAADWTTQTYENIVGRRISSIDFLFRRNSTLRYIGLVWYDGTSNMNVIANAQHPPWAPNQMIWLKAKVDATQVTFAYSEADTPFEPTTWTAIGTPIARTGGAMVHHPVETSPVTIGQTNGTPSPANGRIGRIIIRNPATGGTLLDVNDTNLPGVPAGAQSFTSSDTGNRWAQLPGVIGNYIAIPNSAPLQIGGSFEIVMRCGFAWMDNVVTGQYQTLAGRYETTGTGGRSWWLYMDPTYPGRPRLNVSADGSAAQTATATSAMPFANGQIGWLKTTYDAPTGTTRFYSAPDIGTTVEPAGWTQVGGDRTGGPTSVFPGTARVLLGRQDISDNHPFNGRISRFILRNGIGGTVVADYDATVNLNGISTQAASFALTTGGTATVWRAGSPQLLLVTGRLPVTVTETAPHQVVQALPDTTIWRFDAAEAPAGALSYTDPRGRAWTLTSAVVPANTPPIVTPQPDRTIWRFDANDWPAGALTAVGADGRTYTASNGNAVQHPASEPDP